MNPLAQSRRVKLIRQTDQGRGIAGEDLDMIICGTVTPDVYLPATACQLQHHLGARNIPAFDMHAACSGFLYALNMAEGHIAAGRGEIALVVGVVLLQKLRHAALRAAPG